jgi:inner membrane protein
MQMLGLPVLWGWLGLGLVLIALEMVFAPGSYLLWIGLAALVMAAVAALIPLSPGVEITVFAVLALAFGFVGWRVYGARTKDDAARDLHDLGGGMVGREFLLATAIIDGVGQVKVADSVWRATGADLPAGEKVRVTGVDGSTLLVEKA